MTERVVATRRRVHAEPELGFEEFRTAAYVVARLTAAGWSVRVGREAMDPAYVRGVPEDVDRAWAEAAAELGENAVDAMRGGLTAVVGTRTGQEPGPVVAIRVDMDALAVEESAADDHRPTAEGFGSRRSGVMHACGHDAHVAVALELADRLGDGVFPGTVVLVFQPAEEGLRGALPVARSGVLDDVDDLVCLHVGMGLPLGAVAGSVTGSLASTKLRAVFDGQAAHASMSPERGRNALLAACAATLSLHSLPQRADGAARVSVGVLSCPGAPNVVPARAELRLELRASTDAQWVDLRRRVDSVLAGAAAMHEVELTVTELGGAPAVVCDAGLAAVVVEVAGRTPSVSEAVLCVEDSASDDASWLIDRVRERGGRGTYVAVGAGQAGGHHEADFDIDERALETAVEVLHRTIAELCGQPRGPR